MPYSPEFAFWGFCEVDIEHPAEPHPGTPENTPSLGKARAKVPTKIHELWEDTPLPPGIVAPLECPCQVQEPHKGDLSNVATSERFAEDAHKDERREGGENR